MSQIVIIDLTESFEIKKRLFFDDLTRINKKWSDWFSGRKPLRHEDSRQKEQDSIYYHMSWIEVSQGHPYALLRILPCHERPKELEEEMLNAFKNRFSKFQPHIVT